MHIPQPVKNITCIHKHNDIDDSKIVHALVISLLDYANVLMYGLLAKPNQCFATVQDCATRLI